MAAHSRTAADRLKSAGADLVLLPFRDAAAQAALLITQNKPPHTPAIADPEGQKEFAQ